MILINFPNAFWDIAASLLLRFADDRQVPGSIDSHSPSPKGPNREHLPCIRPKCTDHRRHQRPHCVRLQWSSSFGCFCVSESGLPTTSCVSGSCSTKSEHWSNCGQFLGCFICTSFVVICRKFEPFGRRPEQLHWKKKKMLGMINDLASLNCYRLRRKILKAFRKDNFLFVKVWWRFWADPMKNGCCELFHSSELTLQSGPRPDCIVNRF